LNALTIFNAKYQLQQYGPDCAFLGTCAELFYDHNKDNEALHQYDSVFMYPGYQDSDFVFLGYQVELSFFFL